MPAKSAYQFTLPGLEKKLKKILYPLIKKRDGNVCISCGKTNLVGNGWHAGHFAKAELCNPIYKYDLRNINSQCAGCNNWKEGNFIEYEKAMVKKYGQDVVDEIKDNYNKPMPIEFNKREYIIELINKYLVTKEL